MDRAGRCRGWRRRVVFEALWHAADEQITRWRPRRFASWQDLKNRNNHRDADQHCKVRPLHAPFLLRTYASSQFRYSDHRVTLSASLWLTITFNGLSGRRQNEFSLSVFTWFVTVIHLPQASSSVSRL